MKNALDQLRQKPLKLAMTYLNEAFGKIDSNLNSDAYVLFQRAQLQSQEGVHLADSFETHLKCVQILLISTTLIESAVEMGGKVKSFKTTCSIDAYNLQVPSISYPSMLCPSERRMTLPNNSRQGWKLLFLGLKRNQFLVDFLFAKRSKIK